MLCAVVAVGEPAVPQRGQPAERRPAGRHLRHLQHRRRHRHHHRRHRSVGRVDLRAARRAAVDDAGRVAAGPRRSRWRPWWRSARCLGAAHGLLITRLRLQPFIVTLCGLLLYRGAARYIAARLDEGVRDRRGLRVAARRSRRAASPACRCRSSSCAWWRPSPWVLVHRSVYGRHLFAVGHNEEAARYSGVQHAAVDRVAPT